MSTGQEENPTEGGESKTAENVLETPTDGVGAVVAEATPLTAKDTHKMSQTIDRDE